MQDQNDTAHRILDAAERYTQIHGFNAFSYKDLQNEVGVKTSSIHYYFPTKQDLALNLAKRYLEGFEVTLKTMAAEHGNGLKRLEQLGSLFVEVVKQGKFCLCGMLASDMLALPDAVTSQLCAFFRLAEDWIVEAIELGKAQGQVKPSIAAESAASHFLAALEGGMLIARVQKHPEYLQAVVREALMQLRA